MLKLFLYFVYFSVVGVPIILFIICVIIVAIHRKTSIILSVIMVSMIHPICSLIIGVSTKSFGQFIQMIIPRRCSTSPSVFKKILSRMFTFSINVYFALIGFIIYHLTMIHFWEDTYTDYKDKSYDQCTCQILKTDYDIECKNEDNNFQNAFVRFHIEVLVLAFSMVSLICHIIHSLVLSIPPPIPMLDFILGSTQESKDADNCDEIEMISTEEKHKLEIKTKESKLKWSMIIFLKLASFILSIAFVTTLLVAPTFLIDKKYNQGEKLLLYINT